MATPDQLFVLFIFTICLFDAALSGLVPCPFDNGNNCVCLSDDVKPEYVFQEVECFLSNTSSLTPFIGSSGSYIITGTFKIVSGKLGLSIPANAFLPFDSIRTLNFVSKNGIANLTLDPLALAGPPISGLFLKGFSNLLPLPSGLGLTGKNGLQFLSIEEGAGGPLAANAFLDFRYLSGLAVSNTPISSIDTAAFAGLENTLVQLVLVKDKLDAYPAEAISKLGTSLQKLGLSGNSMKTYPKEAFAPLSKLVKLDLSENDVQAAYDAGAFDQFPPAIDGDLNLESGGLTQVPKRIFDYAPGIAVLSLGENNITELRSGDFAKATGLQSLNLDKNPIATIEPGSLDGLILVQQLPLFRNQLETFDLSLIQGMESLKELYIDYQPLSTVTVPAPDQVPASIEHIEISSTALETVDPNFQPILDRPTFKSLALTKNFYMQCDDALQWIASYALCSKKIDVTGAKCGNIPHKTVLNYLTETVPDPCQ